MNLEDIKKYIEENKDKEEVKEFLGEYAPTIDFGLEEIKKKAEEDAEVRAYFDSMKDSHHNKALETWKSNNLQKIVEEKIKERFPEADERDLAIRELEQKVLEMERAKQFEMLKNKATKEAVAKGLPVDLVDYFISEDEESTLSNLSVLEQAFSSKLETMVEERFKDSSYVPPQNDDKKEYTQEDLANMTADEINAYFDSRL